MQEVITLTVFAFFAMYLGESLTLNLSIGFPVICAAADYLLSGTLS